MKDGSFVAEFERLDPALKRYCTCEVGTSNSVIPMGISRVQLRLKVVGSGRS